MNTSYIIPVQDEFQMNAAGGKQEDTKKCTRSEDTAQKIHVDTNGKQNSSSVHKFRSHKQNQNYNLTLRKFLTIPMHQQMTKKTTTATTLLLTLKAKVNATVADLNVTGLVT